MHRIESEAIHNLADLSSVYGNSHGKHDKMDLEIFEEILPEIIEISKKKEDDRFQEQKITYEELLKDDRDFLRDVYVSPPQSKNQDVINRMDRQRRDQYYDDLVNRSNSKKSACYTLRTKKHYESRIRCTDLSKTYQIRLCLFYYLCSAWSICPIVLYYMGRINI